MLESVMNADCGVGRLRSRRAAMVYYSKVSNNSRSRLDIRVALTYVCPFHIADIRSVHCICH